MKLKKLSMLLSVFTLEICAQDVSGAKPTSAPAVATAPAKSIPAGSKSSTKEASTAAAASQESSKPAATPAALPASGSSTSGASTASAAAPAKTTSAPSKPVVSCTTLSPNNIGNAHACNCPTRDEVNGTLSNLGKLTTTIPNWVMTGLQQSSAACSSFFVPTSIPSLIFGASTYPWCAFSVSQTGTQDCNFSNCYTIGSSSAPIMVYEENSKKASCLSGAPSSTATVSDIGEFQGVSGTTPNIHCNYTNGVVKYHV